MASEDQVGEKHQYSIMEESLMPTPDLSRGEETFKSSQKKNPLPYITVLFITFAVYFVLSIFVGYILFTPLAVEGFSMYPTLNASATGHSGSENTDIVYIKLTSNFERNDIIVFSATGLMNEDWDGKNFIKRVIGMPNDELRFVAQSTPSITNKYKVAFKLFVNGIEVDESKYASEMLMDTSIEKSQIYSNIVSENTIIVPKDSIFVMGDNRGGSTDSREFGFVKIENVIGVVKIHVANGDNIIHSLFHSIKENYLF